MLARARPARSKREPAVFRTRVWAAAAFPLALVSGIEIINQNIDILLLGVLRNVEEVGLYRVVVQVSIFVTFGLSVVDMVMAPEFARLSGTGKFKELERVARLSAAATLALAAPVVVIFVLFGEELLSLAFGSSYGAGSAALAILALGQLVNALTGSVGLLLNMSGNERDTLRAGAAAVLVNVAMNLVLIPPFGLVGAAIATSLSLALWNVILWRYVRLRLGISVFPAFGRRIISKT